MRNKFKLLTLRQKLALFIFIIILAAIPFAVIVSQRSTENRQRASELGLPSLALSPATTTIPVDETLSIQLMLTNPDNVIGIDTTLTFDPTIVEFMSFQPSTINTFNSQLINTIDNQKGTLRYAAANTASNTIDSTLGTITIRTKTEGVASVVFQTTKLILRNQSQAIIPENNIPGSYTIIANGPPSSENVTLALSPNTAAIPVGKPFPVDIYLYTATNKVTGVSFTLQVTNLSQQSEKAITLENVDINQDVFNSILKNTISNNDYIYAAVDTVGKEVNGKVKLGTITLYPEKANTSVNFTFNNVQITAVDTTNNIGASTFPNAATYTLIAQASPSATPTSTVTGDCKVLYEKIQQAFDQTACGDKYAYIADLNKDTYVNNQDYLTFITKTNNGTDQNTCQTYLSTTDNPCAPTNTPTVVPTSTTIPNTPTPTPTPTPTQTQTQPTSTLIPNTPTQAQPTSTPIPPTPKQVNGDINSDTSIDILDYNIWRDEFLGKSNTKTADLNNDGNIDLIDFSIWRNAINKQ